MIKLLQTKWVDIVLKSTLIFGGALLFVAMACNTAYSYETYNGSGDPGCVECHGGFKDGTSTKGSVFPEDDKHEMHKGGSYMNTECNLCHTSGDGKDPFIGSSNGTDNNAGLGCNGCHNAYGLRAHHAANGVVDSEGDSCADCHPGDGPPPGEDEVPPYYGTVDTNANNPTNDVLASNINENWTLNDDFIGLDNDGDNLYDLADFDCGPPYRIVGIEAIGSDIHISWETAGGRTDMLQVTPSLTTNFNDSGTAITISGVGFVTNTTVEVGGVTPTNRFYRIRSEP